MNPECLHILPCLTIRFTVSVYSQAVVDPRTVLGLTLCIGRGPVSRRYIMWSDYRVAEQPPREAVGDVEVIGVANGEQGNPSRNHNAPPPAGATPGATITGQPRAWIALNPAPGTGGQGQALPQGPLQLPAQMIPQIVWQQQPAVAGTSGYVQDRKGAKKKQKHKNVKKGKGKCSRSKAKSKKCKKTETPPTTSSESSSSDSESSR